MSYTPLNYNQINQINGFYSPSMVKSCNNATFAYWERSLYQRICSVIEFKLSDNWQGKVKDFFLYCLFKYGYVAIFNDKNYGLSFQPCALSGYNFYYQPTEAIVSNPKLNKRFTIGKDCELVTLTSDYFGVWDIIVYYAEKLSALDSAINMSIINNKFAYVLGAKNKSGAEALKKICDKINKGEPTVVYDYKILDDAMSKSTPFQFLERNNLKQSYLTTDQLNDFQTLLNNFDAEIGIPSANTQKRERLITSEAESRQIDATARAVSWVDCLNGSFEIVNSHFGTDMNASLRFEPMEQIEESEVDADE